MLYKVDTRLRPHGGSGPLAVSLDAFLAYFLGHAATWERMALTRARPLFSTGTFNRDVTAAVRRVLTASNDCERLAAEALAMRRRLGASRGPNDLKRGVGGLVDIEFLVQYLMLKHACDEPDVLRANVWEALDALRRHGPLSPADHAALRDSYDFLRTVEGRLRIVHNRTDVGLPDDPAELARLARRLGYEDDGDGVAEALFRSDIARMTARTRSLFVQVVGDPCGGPPR